MKQCWMPWWKIPWEWQQTVVRMTQVTLSTQQPFWIACQMLRRWVVLACSEKSQASETTGTFSSWTSNVSELFIRSSGSLGFVMLLIFAMNWRVCIAGFALVLIWYCFFKMEWKTVICTFTWLDKWLFLCVFLLNFCGALWSVWCNYLGKSIPLS